MTVKELMSYLRDCNPQDRVLIATQVGNYMGTKPGVNIAHTYDGFDWDEGNVYLVGNLDLEVIKNTEGK